MECLLEAILRLCGRKLYSCFWRVSSCSFKIVFLAFHRVKNYKNFSISSSQVIVAVNLLVESFFFVVVVDHRHVLLLLSGHLPALFFISSLTLHIAHLHLWELQRQVMSTWFFMWVQMGLSH